MTPEKRQEIQDAIDAALKPFKHDLVDESLYANIKGALEPVLRQIAEKRKPAITVICDKTNNSPDSIAAGQLNVKLRIDPALASPAELAMWQRLHEDKCDHPNRVTTGWSQGSVEHFHCPDCNNRWSD